ncbi:similar to Saccharomyces cerevisiae YAR014C BUD14 Protein involved in bud-site selection, Bud14p-Glc7p complex is a cortical regulator of dynein [Maudiozyma saulgeensis]|uniref:Similar to Saccharomyces cerevisiae YAR014C BUD14 Protein involved in bud-site selection, Bud14p-Glc7p complex is a cortical regulator of dynein n=1 Tax=Maudiozyma saulgeensis TaxID=1789683 RepID=A0A1X7R418_9SACH|nr:similar to Saccharomyces cerevisiae YAR014C BUD14 Protein involved in bud-site selection, Bud14p-Glc7p complex is a cortical regulator of dynein [Kazachstania saulgeensis]
MLVRHTEMSHCASVDQLTTNENDGVKISKMNSNHSHSEEFLSNKSHDSSFDINNYNTDDLEEAVSESDSNLDLDSLEYTQSRPETLTPQVITSDVSDKNELEEYYQPLPPPKELDPDKLYALYAFTGTDPSYCQLKQDEDCILLNDEDAYWWLVKRCRDDAIGFAPAELLETFCERLARLNSWKNEQALLNQIRYGPNHQQLKNYKKGNKSVSFSEVVIYAEDNDGNNTSNIVQSKNILEGLNDELPDADSITKPLNLSTFPKSSSSLLLSDKHIISSSTRIGNYITDSGPLPSLSIEGSGATDNSLHPYIAHLYTPVFAQVDDLIGKLNTWIA